MLPIVLYQGNIQVYYVFILVVEELLEIDSAIQFLFQEMGSTISSLSKMKHNEFSTPFENDIQIYFKNIGPV